MTNREYELLVLFLKARTVAAGILATLLAAVTVFLVFALADEGTNETLSTLLGIGMGALGTGLGVVINAIAKDVTEHIETMRQLPERKDG